MKAALKTKKSQPETPQPLVKDMMTRDVVTLAKEDSVKLLRDIFELKRIRHVPITDGDNNLVGLVTQRDFLTVAISKFAHFARPELDEIYSRITVADIMGKKFVATSPEAPIGEAAELMFRNKYGCLPVVSGGKLVGIITEADFVRAFAQAFGQARTGFRGV